MRKVTIRDIQKSYSLLLAHGTDALITAFKCLPIEDGEKIGVPSLTWVATASAIIHAESSCFP